MSDSPRAPTFFAVVHRVAPRYTFPRAMAALAKDAYARAALVTMACALAAAVGADTGAFAAFHVQPIWDCMMAPTLGNYSRGACHIRNN